MLVLICHINLLLKTLPSYIENNCVIPFVTSKVQKQGKKKSFNNFVGYKKERYQKKQIKINR